jgi:cell division septation protein DedD
MELARFGQAQLDPMTVAQVFKASGMFPDIQSEAAACAKIIIGRGLGLSDYDAMTGLHIIKGKAVLAANLMAASIKRAGKYDYRATCSDTECSIVFFGRTMDGKWEEIGTTEFTLEDARRAQLGGDNWRKWPKAMLFARCISSGYKQHCPDALGAAPVYVEAHGETEIVEDAPRSRAALPAPEVVEATTLPQDAPVAVEAPKPVRKRKAAPEASAPAPAPAPKPTEQAEPADTYPDEYEGTFAILRVVRRKDKPIAIQVAGDHGTAWVATTVGEYGMLADKADEMRLDIARVGNALTIMRVLSTVERKPAPTPADDDLSMPF